MQISWVLSEKERDRRYNKLKKVGFRNEFQPRTNSESSSSTVVAVANAGSRNKLQHRTNSESSDNYFSTVVAVANAGSRNQLQHRTNSESSDNYFSTVDAFKNIGSRNEFHFRTNSESSDVVATIPKVTFGFGITPDIQFTLEEHLHLESLRSYMSNVSKTRYESFFFYEKACLNHLAEVSYFGGTMNYDHWKRFIEASDNFAQEMFFNLEIMKEFRPNDQVDFMFNFLIIKTLKTLQFKYSKKCLK